jgi:arsenite-transporting ATPase
MLNQLQLVMLSGKGGVGKTTLACGWARQWAREFPDESILLMSTDPAHSIGDMLQVPVEDIAQPMSDLPNLRVRALDAEKLLKEFREKYGEVLQLLVERGSFVEGEDLAPVWDMSWPGLNELMGLLEIQRLFRENEVNRLVVDMAPTGHALNLLRLMDFLDQLLESVELFQEKHRAISRSFTGRYVEDEGDDFLRDMKEDLSQGRALIQDPDRTACVLVGIAEPMSFAETSRFRDQLEQLEIPFGGIIVNRTIADNQTEGDRFLEQSKLLQQFLSLAPSSDIPVLRSPQLTDPPLGNEAIDRLFTQLLPITENPVTSEDPQPLSIQWPDPIPPSLPDFIAQGQKLIIVGGKGGVGKTTVAASLGWGLSQRYPDKKIRIISIDPAHSLGDAFGQPLGHEAIAITDNLSGQEIDTDVILDQFREDYLWELAEMMSGDTDDPNNPISLAYGPKAWRQIVGQSLPGIDEMLSLLEIMDQLEKKQQDLIIIDSAPTGHLLRFLEMPEALSDWLAWIFKLWMKYQDALGRVEFMGTLRTLRKRVVNSHKKLKDSNHTDFVGVVQAEAAIIAEAKRLTESLTEMGVTQNYIVHNRYQTGIEIDADSFPDRAIVRLPVLPRFVEPLAQIQGAAKLLIS